MDKYKVEIINEHIKALAEDEYHLAQLSGGHFKNINLDENALILLRQYYEGKIKPGSMSVETPDGDIVVEAKGATEEYPGVYVTTVKDGCEEQIATCEYDTLQNRFQVASYAYGKDAPSAIYLPEEGTFAY